MIRVGDFIVSTPVEEILVLLRTELAASGVIRFQKIKRNLNNVMTQCPFHSNGLEKKPSFGISDTGECHCFACGWSSKRFDQFVSELFGYYDGGDFGRSWIYGQMNDPTAARKIVLPFESAKPNHNKVIISEEELDSYRYTHPYLYQRGLTDELIEEFDIGYDPNRGCVTFPVKDIKGDVVFVATRSVTTKFFTLPEGDSKPVYLADRFVTGKYKKAVLVESFFNALTCWKYGFPAMALIGTGSKPQMDILRQLPVKHYILGLDPDEAGERGVQRIKYALQGHKILTRWKLPKDKDINDLDSEIITLKEMFI